MLVHLPMGDADPRLGNQLLHLAAHGGDGLYPVVDEEHLPAAVQLAQDGLARPGAASKGPRG